MMDNYSFCDYVKLQIKDKKKAGELIEFSKSREIQCLNCEPSDSDEWNDGNERHKRAVNALRVAQDDLRAIALMLDGALGREGERVDQAVRLMDSGILSIKLDFN